MTKISMFVVLVVVPMTLAASHTSSAEIPAHYRGKWMAGTSDICDRSNDGYLAVTKGTARYHEGTSDVLSVRRIRDADCQIIALGRQWCPGEDSNLHGSHR
jgi:hypothetical protein